MGRVFRMVSSLPTTLQTSLLTFLLYPFSFLRLAVHDYICDIRHAAPKLNSLNRLVVRINGGGPRAEGADSGEERRSVTMLLKCILVNQFPAVCVLSRY